MLLLEEDLIPAGGGDEAPEDDLSSSSLCGDSVPGLEAPSESLRVKYPGESALASLEPVDVEDCWSSLATAELGCEGGGRALIGGDEEGIVSEEEEEPDRNKIPGAIFPGTSRKLSLITEEKASSLE